MNARDDKSVRDRDAENEERDQGYGASHGYGPGHGGPSGPGDAPAEPTSRPRAAHRRSPCASGPRDDEETTRPSEAPPGER